MITFFVPYSRFFPIYLEFTEKRAIFATKNKIEREIIVKRWLKISLSR